MRIKIYQINNERDINQVGFMSYDRLERLQGTSAIDSKIYDLVYDNTMDFNNLEEIYREFNINHPADYRGHSLSISDIVEISDSNKIENGFYFCDSFGFKKVIFEPKDSRISERCNNNSATGKIEERIGAASQRVGAKLQPANDITHKKETPDR